MEYDFFVYNYDNIADSIAVLSHLNGGDWNEKVTNFSCR